MDSLDVTVSPTYDFIPLIPTILPQGTLSTISRLAPFIINICWILLCCFSLLRYISMPLTIVPEYSLPVEISPA